MNKRRIARQGDITHKEVFDHELPEGLVLAQSSNELTVALGGMTGHHHTLYGSLPIELLQSNNDRYIRIKEDVMFKHQEHREFLVPGNATYKIINEREYDYFSKQIAKVKD